jgi:enoyl-CoA hydratase
LPVRRSSDPGDAPQGNLPLSDLVAFRIRISGHVAEVTLLGPGPGNAMGPEFWTELPVIFAWLDRHPAVRTASGPAAAQKQRAPR